MISKQALKGPLGVSLASAALILIGAIFALPAIVDLFRTPRYEPRDVTAALDLRMERHEESRKTFQDRFIGRSIFFRPPAPAPPRVEPQPRVDPDPPQREPEPPRAPDTYRGPLPVAVFGNEVWFQNNMRIALGEERQGVKVLEVNPPWSVRLARDGGEYDVDIFNRHDVFSGTASRSSSDPPGMESRESTARGSQPPSEPRRMSDDAPARPAARVMDRSEMPASLQRDDGDDDDGMTSRGSDAGSAAQDD